MIIERWLPAEPDTMAPDGMEVRLLATASRGSMAHFRLLAGQVGRAVCHRTVDEIWFCSAGEGEMWLADDHSERTIAARPGVSFSIPVGTRFQLRTIGDQPVDFLGVTMPPWPGDEEATIVAGPWDAQGSW